MTNEKTPFFKAAKMPATPSPNDLLAKANTTAKATGMQFSHLAREAMTSENLEQVSRVAAERVDEIAKSLKTGSMPLRVMALLAGLAVVFLALGGILSSLFSFNLASLVIEIYTVCFGCAMILMETSFVKIPPEYMDQLYKYCFFLKFIWGRGALYIVTGSLQAAQGGLLDLIVGLYVMFVGLLYIVVGRASARKLSEMKHSIFSEDSLKAKFKKHDKDNSGAITMDEFSALVKTLDLDMTKREMEGIFFHLDTNDDDRLVYEEFSKWWNGFDASAASV